MKIISKLNLSIILFLTALSIYIITAAPDLMFTDSGELAGVCVTLGIAHPTGYPLFAILGHIFSLIPMGISKIYQLNLMASIFTALSSVVFFQSLLIVLELVNKKKNQQKIKNKQVAVNETNLLENGNILLISFFTSLIYTFATTVWQQANAIEVYSLQALMFNLVIWSILKSSSAKENQFKLYLFTSFLLGLSFTNHMQTILLMPGVFYLYVFGIGDSHKLDKSKLKEIIWLLVPFIIGLSLILYLPLRSMSMPDFNWGFVSRSWSKFIYHASGKQYQIWMFSDSGSISTNLGKFFTLLPYQLGWIGLIPFLLGIYFLFRQNRKLLFFLLILLLTCLSYSVNYSIHDIDSYFLLAFISIIIITGAGIFLFISKYPKLVAAIVIIPIISLLINFDSNDNSKNYLVPEYTRILSENLEPNAIVISAQWDYWCSAFWYKQKVEGYRTDVVLIEKELLRRTWYLEQFKKWYPATAKLVENEMALYLGQLELFESEQEYNPVLIQQYYVGLINALIDKNYGTKPVYVTLDVIESSADAEIAFKYQKIPQGFAFRLEKENNFYQTNLDKIDVAKFLEFKKDRNNHLVQGILSVASLNVTNIGRYAQSTNDTETARKSFEMALKIDPTNQNAQIGLQQILNIKQ